MEKNADKGAKCRLDSFRRRGYLKFHSLGGLHAGEKIKKHPLEGSQGEGNRGPGPVLMFNTTLSPCHGPKKPAAWAATPREAG